jgi:uncharacterized protein with HEPN domain
LIATASVSSSDEAKRLRDVIENIDRAMSYVGRLSFAAFSRDTMRVDAVERCIERITEALIKIGEDRVKTLVADTPIAAFRQLGNIMRHEYDGVDTRRIFELTTERLPGLRQQCMRRLAREFGVAGQRNAPNAED